MARTNPSSVIIEEIHTNPDGSFEQIETRPWGSIDEGFPSSSYDSGRGVYLYDDITDGYYRNKYDLYGTRPFTSDIINVGEIHTSGPEETNEYLRRSAVNIYKDPNPQTITRAAAQDPIRYEQQIQVRYLQPPAVPPPGPLIIKEVRPPQSPPPPPLIIHEHAPSPPSPPPIILRERPPTPPPHIPSETVVRNLSPIPVPPRSVIIKRFAAPPKKPRDILIERWIPYGPQPERQTIVQRAPPPIVYPQPRNQIIIYEPGQANINRRFQKLDVLRENPADYIARYGSTLLDPAILLQRARDIGVYEDLSPPVVSSMYLNRYRTTFDYDWSNEIIGSSTGTRTREISLVWSTSSTANFSAVDLPALSVLQWAENVTVPAATTSLPTTCDGPEGWSNVSFSAVYHKTNEKIIIEANIDDQFNFYNYGRYQVTIYYPNSQTAIDTFVVYIEPKDAICMPNQFIIRDSLNNILVNTTVQIRLKGKVVFTGTTNSQGIVNLPQTLSNNCYDVEINTHQDKYKIAKFKLIVFENRGSESVTYFIARQMQHDEVEFVLKWGAKPKDLDSHVFVSDGRHVYFSNKKERNVSLDYDSREGGGPETIKVKVERNMKYIYAVHRYSKDGELAKSDAIVTISTDEMLGPDSSYAIVSVPHVNQPQANYWVVCQIDGTTKKIKFFDRKFENEDDHSTDKVVRKYYNA